MLATSCYILLQLFTDGVVNLRENSSSSSFASIYPFSADVDTRAVGQVLYREGGVLNPELLNAAEDLVRQLFSCFGNFTPTSVFVATWFYVGYFENNNDLVSGMKQTCFLLDLAVGKYMLLRKLSNLVHAQLITSYMFSIIHYSPTHFSV